MPKLGLTQKQETFTQNLFKGMTQHGAWINAGYSSNYSGSIIDQNACNLAKQSKIQVRLSELRALVSKSNIMTVKERQERLSEISRANLTEFIDKDGNITLETDNPGALQEVTVTELRSGQKKPISTTNTKVKLHNPISAIAELNKMDGIYETGGLTLKANEIKVLWMTEVSRPEEIEESKADIEAVALEVREEKEG